MTMTIQPLAPFGAEITGVDNISQVNWDTLLQLQQLLAEQGVVVIRQQYISDAEFVSFLRQLGPLMFTAGEIPVSDQPWLNLVSNVRHQITHGRPPRSVFHTDTSYVAQPPAYTALKAVQLPTSGGATLFSNQYHAYDRLPEGVKHQLAKTKVHHVISGVSPDIDGEKASWHPLFQRHPISGKTALFLSTPERCQALSDFPSAEGQRIIRLLYRHSIRPHKLYRHEWQLGDIVIWDNRATMHRADHSAVIGDRVLHRGLVGAV